MNKLKLSTIALALTALVSQSSVYAVPDLEDTHNHRKYVNSPNTETSQAQNEESSSWLWSGLKCVGGIIGSACLTEKLTDAGSKAINAAVTHATGSSYAGKAAEIASYDTVYRLARDAAFIAGFNSPDLLTEAYKVATNVWSKPSIAFNFLSEVAETGARMVSTQVGSYLLTQPLTNITSDAVNLGVTFMTGSPTLGQAAGVATKATIHYTGLGNLAAKTVGYYLPEVAAKAYNATSSTFGYLKGLVSAPAA